MLDLPADAYQLLGCLAGMAVDACELLTYLPDLSADAYQLLGCLAGMAVDACELLPSLPGLSADASELLGCQLFPLVMPAIAGIFRNWD